MERVSRRNVYTGKGRRKRPFDGANPLFRFAINFWKRNRGTHERKHTMEEDPCEKKWGGGGKGGVWEKNGPVASKGTERFLLSFVVEPRGATPSSKLASVRAQWIYKNAISTRLHNGGWNKKAGVNGATPLNKFDRGGVGSINTAGQFRHLN